MLETGIRPRVVDVRVRGARWREPIVAEYSWVQEGSMRRTLVLAALLAAGAPPLVAVGPQPAPGIVEVACHG